MTHMTAVLRPQSLREEALTKIREAIVFGALPGGQLFSEQTIADQLQISRTPVREALLQLGSEGLIEFVPNRGARIVPVSSEYLRQVFELRASIEGYCGKQLAAASSRKRILDKLDASLAEQRQIIDTNDQSAWVAANMRFHMLMVEDYGNPLMIDVLNNLATHTMRMGYQVNERANDRMEQSLTEHTLIVEAMREGQPDVVVRRIEDHLAATGLLVNSLIGPGAEKISGSTGVVEDSMGRK
ncbi:GntR family transcriptional regulator [Microvirga alba]|uniref:GntR family transcriptional regulator n=1 Tax=Microvirga alba TaxID=2791025 RepID=A0A931FSF5_9HYPH|nr:GntR family transcriptional regulator [Microvirga alba]MBF9233661.1 GntR family transcriptional regulator [Microvirga alba]